MTPEHKDWEDFRSLLRTSLNDDPDECDETFHFTKEILAEHFPEIDVAESIKVYEDCGCNCDCLVMDAFEKRTQEVTLEAFKEKVQHLTQEISNLSCDMFDAFSVIEQIVTHCVASEIRFAMPAILQKAREAIQKTSEAIRE
jgi:hypothetical protein